MRSGLKIACHTLLILFFAGGFSSPLSAQTKYKITGKIINSKDNSPIEFAEIKILTPDTTLLHFVYSSPTGTFQTEAKAGEYILEVKYLGKPFYNKYILVTRDIALENILIDPSKSERGVTVVSKKKLIEQKIDRLVFNVENSVMSEGMDLTQVLKNIPMVNADDFSVSIIGKSTVLVMIEDRIINMSGSDLMNYLKTLRSNDIARIEVITTPPAKYVAQGNSGLINIIMKKNSQMGWSGNYSTSYIQATYPGYTNNFSLNYRSDKIHTTLRLRQYDRDMKSLEKIDVLGQNSIISSDRRKDMDNGIGANINFFYKINNMSDVGFIYDMGRLNSNMNISNRSDYKTSDHLDSTLYTLSRHRNQIITKSLNAFYNLKMDSLGRKLSIGINYFSNSPRPDVNFETFSTNTSFTYNVFNQSKIDYSILSGQLDFYLPFRKTIVEAGAMITDFTNSSDVQYLNFEQSHYVLDPSRSNIFDYDEKNYAAYISGNRDFGKKWSVKAGLRYEYSVIHGVSVTTGQSTKYNYDNLFPTLYIKYSINKTNSVGITYSKRINRPNFRALNPFRWYSNPYTFSTGNPVLQPSYNHNAEITYLYKNQLSVTLYGQKLTNGYGRIVSVNDGVKEVNYKNYLTEYNLGANASLYVSPKSWWDLNSNLTAFYSSSETTISEVLPQNGFSAYYTINNTFTISKAKQVFAYVNFWNSLPARRGNSYSKNLSSLTAGVRFSLFKSRLRVNTSVEDVYKGIVSKGTIYFNDFIQQYNNYYDARRLTISLTYEFGNKNVSANSRQVRFNERNRIN